MGKEAVPERPRVVSREEWLVERLVHLEKEKAIARKLDELMEERRRLPWIKVEKEYLFDGPGGSVTLSDLFEGRSQLFIYHFMFGPDWDQGCPFCSFMADHVDGARIHFENHDVKFAAVSRAPIEKIVGFKKRMGWCFNWVSSFNSDFNFDYEVSFPDAEASKKNYYFAETGFPGSEAPGISVFYKDQSGEIYHTYSTYVQGGDILLGALNFLDMTPKGRNEGDGMWVRYHDKYDESPVSLTCSEEKL